MCLGKTIEKTSAASKNAKVLFDLKLSVAGHGYLVVSKKVSRL